LGEGESADSPFFVRVVHNAMHHFDALYCAFRSASVASVAASMISISA
jgi:hypothetical protein